jgi:protein MAK11
MLQLTLPIECNRASTTIVSTVSSDGHIRVYDMNDIPSPSEASAEPLQISPVAEYNTDKTRLTCLTLADGDAESTTEVGDKRKREDEDDDEEEDDDDEDGDSDSEDGDEDEEQGGFGSGWEDEEEADLEGDVEEESD